MVEILKKKNNQETYSFLLDEYKYKRDKAELDANERRLAYYAKYDDLKKLDEKISDLWHKKAMLRLDGKERDEKIIDSEIVEQLAEKSSLLDKYKIKDFDAIYECDKCHDTGFIHGEKCSCLKEKENYYLKNNYSAFSSFYNNRFENINYDLYDQKNIAENPEKSYLQYMKKNIESLKEKVDLIKKEPLNLYLMGQVGTGKTFLANCIVNKALDNKLEVVNISSVDLNKLFFEKDSEASLQALYRVDLLIVDDLGAEWSSGYSNQNLFSIIDKRLLFNKSTVITTNLNYDELKNYYQERIASRIINKFVLFKLYGRDLRIEI